VSEAKNRKQRLVWIVGIACALGGFATGAIAAGKKQQLVVPFSEAKWGPMDPANAAGPQVAVLWGDPKKGSSAVLLKLKKGPAPLHTHSADYQAALIQGSTKHWDKGQEEKDAVALTPGSFWFQPGKQPHGDSCLSDECVIFVSWAGKMDFKVAEQPKK